MPKPDPHLALEKKAPLTPIPEPVAVIRPPIASISAVQETRKIIPAGVAITETEQEN